MDFLSVSTEARVNSLADVACTGTDVEVMGCDRTWQARWCGLLFVQGLLALLWGCTLAPPLPAPTAPQAVPLASSSELARLDESERVWRQWREHSKGDYHYVVRWQSRVGFGHVTTVRVVQHRVVERRFEAFTLEVSQASRAKTVQDSWLEQGSQVGSRAGSAAAALTLDELYGVCRRLLNEPRVALAGPQPQWQPPVLTLDSRGILQSCQSTLAKVMGDAPQRGVLALELHLDK
jgi:hypothetical protein